jgi:hypothetical protein
MATDLADTATAVEEFAVGAAETAAEVATHPVGAVRKQVRSFERKGQPAVRRFNRRLNAMIPSKIEVFGIEVNDRFPEKLAIKSLHMVRFQAKRDDVVGTVAKRTLKAFNGSFKTIARTATRLEEASTLVPHRETHRETERKPVRRRARTARRRAA